MVRQQSAAIINQRKHSYLLARQIGLTMHLPLSPPSATSTSCSQFYPGQSQLQVVQLPEGNARITCTSGFPHCFSLFSPPLLQHLFTLGAILFRLPLQGTTSSPSPSTFRQGLTSSLFHSFRSSQHCSTSSLPTPSQRFLSLPPSLLSSAPRPFSDYLALPPLLDHSYHMLSLSRASAAAGPLWLHSPFLLLSASPT